MDYLQGKQTLQQFYEWFIPETTDAHQWASADLLDQIYAIKLILAEHDYGLESEEELKMRLLHLNTTE